MSTHHITKRRIVAISPEDKNDYRFNPSKRKGIIRKAMMTEGREFYGNISKEKLSRSGLYNPDNEKSSLTVRRISDMTDEEKKELGITSPANARVCTPARASS